MTDFTDIVITSNGPQGFPSVAINTEFDAYITIDRALFGETFNFTGFSAAVLIDTYLFGSLVSFGDTFNAITILSGAGVIGEEGKIQLLGMNTQILANAGEADADVTFGGGQGLIINSGYMGGDIRMGDGDDFFINQIANSESPDTFGLVLGPVRMGSGDDVVQNASTMGRVFLGNGNDIYSVVNPVDDPGENFNAENASATIVRGGFGNDTIFGGDADDLFYGDANNDLLRGHGGDDKLVGGQGKDTLQGGNGEDRLMGNQSQDYLVGGNGDDTLNGGSGQDTLIGGRGDDRLVGGSGADTFQFFGNSGSDTIADFNVGQDLIRLPIVAQGNSELGRFVGWFGDEDVMEFITYADGNAIVDLSSLYKTYNDLFDSNALPQTDGIQITLLGVSEGSLTGDNFYTPQDVLPPEYIELL